MLTRIKTELKYERTEVISEHDLTSNITYCMNADNTEIFVQCDLGVRRRKAVGPEHVKSRVTAGIAHELGKLDYNKAKHYLRNTRYRSVLSKDDEENYSFFIDVVVSDEGNESAS